MGGVTRLLPPQLNGLLSMYKYAQGSKHVFAGVRIVKKSMILNLSKLHSQQEAMFSSLRDRTQAYIAKFGYRQNQIAEAIGVSESHIADFLSARRGLSDITFAKLEHILSLNATQRKLQFYTGGNTGTRMCNLQAKGKTLKGQVKFGDSYGDAIQETKAAFSKFNQEKLEV
jgi:transcriptional regulator with XRE-family HTH domain